MGRCDDGVVKSNSLDQDVGAVSIPGYFAHLFVTFFLFWCANVRYESAGITKGEGKVCRGLVHSASRVRFSITPSRRNGPDRTTLAVWWGTSLLFLFLPPPADEDAGFKY